MSLSMPSIILLSSAMLSGETFVGGEAGISVPETVCKSTAVGISVDVNTYEPHLLAGTMAHMIGHNIGMGHDDNRKEARFLVSIEIPTILFVIYKQVKSASVEIGMVA